MGPVSSHHRFCEGTGMRPAAAGGMQYSLADKSGERQPATRVPHESPSTRQRPLPHAARNWHEAWGSELPCCRGGRDNYSYGSLSEEDPKSTLVSSLDGLT